jgi:hypothetical protein
MKHILSLLAGLLCLTFLQSQATRSQAESLAKHFLNERNELRGDALAYHLNEVIPLPAGSKSALAWVFNFSPGAWVMVAAEESAYPILAYGYEGYWEPSPEHPGLQLWLSQYFFEIELARKARLEGKAGLAHPAWAHYLQQKSPDKTKFRSVLPLLTSTWDQGYPYNQLCPEDPNGVAGNAVVGCVATACAQLMYYFRYPESGSGSYTYYHPLYDTLTVDFANAVYEYDKMTDYTTVYNEEIAEISYHFGVSVDMLYGPASSGMYNHKAAYSLATHFNFSPETQYVYRDSTTMDWDSLLLNHLDRSIPMYYAGWAAPGSSSGHAFIADGYEMTSQGLHYHFNWGWGGSQDGYFYTNNLTPGGAQFTFSQELIINAYPDTSQYSYPAYCSGQKELNARNGSIDDGSGPTRDYLALSRCSWLIRPQTEAWDSVEAIRLQIRRLDTESGTDQLRIYDGADSTANLLGVFTGSNPPPLLQTTGNEAFIQFVSDSSQNAKGFFLMYESVNPQYCAGLQNITAPSGSIGDGSGDKHYNNSTLCRWLIEPPGAVSLSLNFTRFNTQAGKDVLKVYDWGSQALLGSFSGAQLPPVLTAPSGAMYLEFSTDTDIRMDGWEANYSGSAAGIMALNELRLQVFPNPARKAVMWEIESVEKAPVQMSLSDLQGKILRQWLHQEKQGSLSLEGIPSGMYLLSITNGKSSTYRKLVIL